MTALFDNEGRFQGHDPNEGCEHRTVGDHRFAVGKCANCGLSIEREVDGWVHVCTAERLCEGYPHYGNASALPVLELGDVLNE